VAVAPDSSKVAKGFSREGPLHRGARQFFHRYLRLRGHRAAPATTQLEHYDVHTAYGHLNVMATARPLAPLGEIAPEQRGIQRLAARMGFAEDCFRTRTRHLPPALESSKPSMQGIGGKRSKRKAGSA